MKKNWFLLAAALVAILAGQGFSAGGGYFSGLVKLPKSVENWEHLIVLVCAEANPMCDKPVAVIKPKPVFATSRNAPFVSPRLEPGKYTVYAMNDKNDNRSHDHEVEEIGGVFQEGTFDPLLLEPSKRGLVIEVIGF